MLYILLLGWMIEYGIAVMGFNSEAPRVMQDSALPSNVVNRIISENDDGIVRGTIALIPRSTVRSRGIYGRGSSEPEQSADMQAPMAIWVTGTGSVTGTPTGSMISREDEKPVLNQVELRFDPSIVMVNQGEQVRILNSDPVYHNVFSLSRTKRFDVGRRPQGDHMDVTFENAGIVDVFCDIHPSMHAVVIVVPPETIHRQQMQQAGDFEFQLPAGEYEFHLYSSGYQIYRQEITVTAGELLNLGTISLEP
ncbi:MAG: hypothetical protein WD097_10075 [Balneolales bacterium]